MNVSQYQEPIVKNYKKHCWDTHVRPFFHVFWTNKVSKKLTDQIQIICASEAKEAD